MASKSKINKLSRSPPAIQVATSVDAKDVIPGKLTDKEWHDLIDIDEGVVIVCEMVEEIVEKASNIIYESYLDAEVYSYAVQRAKQSMLKIIGLQFIARDEGEKNTATDPSWLPSQVPAPPLIDPWARGVIPLATNESLTSLAGAMDPIELQVSCYEEEEEVSSSRYLTDDTNPSYISHQTSSNTSPMSSSRRKASKVKRLHGRPVARRSEAKLVALNENPPPTWREEEVQQTDEHSSLRINTTPLLIDEATPTPFGLKPMQLTWMKEIKYDRKGSIVDMIKLDPAKFPSHSVKPHVSISRPPKYHQKHGLVKRPTKLEPMKSYPFPKNKPRYSVAKITSPLKSKHLHFDRDGSTGTGASATTMEGGNNDVDGSSYSDIRGCEARSTTVMPSASGLSMKGSKMRFPEMPTMPSLVDTIDPLPGVTVREGGRSVQGPTPHYEPPTSPRNHLRPVKPPREEKMGVVVGREAGKGVKTEIIASKFTKPVVTAS